MFDRTLIHRDGDTHVHVKQLPHDTADAARLYGEMVAKAEKEVAKATVERLGAENTATLVKITSEASMEDRTVRTRVLFSVNGKQYDIRNVTTETARDELRMAIVREIARQIDIALS